jgi:tRNA (cytidine/uridine-2'-O-)-methyltransferase
MNGPGPPSHTPAQIPGQAPGQIDYHPRLHIVLHEPEIPPNTGAVGRTCLAVGAKLWLIRPLGFRIDQKTLRRAGLDYWRHLAWEAVDNYAALDIPLSSSRRWFFTKTADRLYTEAAFQPGDALVFGSESRGLPPSLLEAHRDRLLRIPIRSEVRSLNLSCAVAVAAYEAVRQWRVQSA